MWKEYRFVLLYSSFIRWLTCGTINWGFANSCFNVMEGVYPAGERSRFSLLGWKWAQSRCTGSSEQSVELSFTRVTGDLICGAPAEMRTNEMKRSCNRSANGASDLGCLARETCLQTSHQAENDRLTLFEPLPNSLFYSKSGLYMCTHTETCEPAHVKTNQHANTQMQSLSWQILLSNITGEIQTLIANVFWQLTYEQHSVRRCQRELWRREISARPNLPPALVLTCWRLTSFSFLIPSVWIWEEHYRSATVRFAACKKNIHTYNQCVCVCVSLWTLTLL